MTELHDSVFDNNLGKVSYFIEKGLDVNVTNNFEETPLHLAAGKGYYDIARLLIGKGADVNAREVDGRTPLHLTLSPWCQHAEIMALLIKKGADVNIKCKGGYTPLCVASALGTTETVKLLLEKGANFDSLVLEVASSRGHTEIVELLKPNGAE